ncbi:hypothetical protein [Rickettsia endosymbiont of Polydrusus tereticollis]|uniref:hypothetical protein n=1 Tax=Rickettsia endosymbiont of Polydrusus tereticollis TaxID=3066251 RepID=UPI003132B1EF
MSAESALIKRTIFFTSSFCLRPYSIAKVLLPVPAKALIITHCSVLKILSMLPSPDIA